MTTTISYLLFCQIGHRLIHTHLKGLGQRAHHPLQLQLPEPPFGDRPHEFNPIQIRPVGHVPKHVDVQSFHHLCGDSRLVDLAVVQQHRHRLINHQRMQAFQELAELLAIERRWPPLEQD